MSWLICCSPSCNLFWNAMKNISSIVQPPITAVLVNTIRNNRTLRLLNFGIFI